MSCVQSRELDKQARLVFRGLSSWEASVTLYLSFRFQTQSMIAICRPFVAAFAVLRELLIVSVGTMGVLFNLGIALSMLWGRGDLMGCVQGRGLGKQARLAFRGLSCWEASVTLYLSFRFQTQTMIAICSRFCIPEGVNLKRHFGPFLFIQNGFLQYMPMASFKV